MSDLTPNDAHFLQRPSPNDEIDLKELFVVLWSGKWLISVVTGLAAAISVVVALSLPNIYTASALLAPAESSNGGLPSIMKQYGGLASLAGVSLPGSEEGSRAQLGIQLMKSRAFIGDFVERRNILPVLMAAESWDAGSGEIVFDANDFDTVTATWIREADPPKKPQPSLLEAHEEFMGILGVSQDKQTGYVTVSVDHYSPVVAAQWVSWLIEDVNAAVKSQDVAEAEKSIEYLKQQVANTSLADLTACDAGCRRLRRSRRLQHLWRLHCHQRLQWHSAGCCCLGWAGWGCFLPCCFCNGSPLRRGTARSARRALWPHRFHWAASAHAAGPTQTAHHLS